MSNQNDIKTHNHFAASQLCENSIKLTQMRTHSPPTLQTRKQSTAESFDSEICQTNLTILQHSDPNLETL